MQLTRRDFTRLALAGSAGFALAPPLLGATRKNPIIDGWYADPEARIFENE